MFAKKHRSGNAQLRAQQLWQREAGLEAVCILNAFYPVLTSQFQNWVPFPSALYTVCAYMSSA